jgi:hypothetical protein
LSEENIAKEKCGHRQKHEKDTNEALPVREPRSTCEGPDRKAGHERGHACYPPLDPITTFQEVSSYTHESHEVGADAGHQQQVTDKHNVIDYVN